MIMADKKIGGVKPFSKKRLFTSGHSGEEKYQDYRDLIDNFTREDITLSDITVDKFLMKKESTNIRSIGPQIRALGRSSVIPATPIVTTKLGGLLGAIVGMGLFSPITAIAGGVYGAGLGMTLAAHLLEENFVKTDPYSISLAKSFIGVINQENKELKYIGGTKTITVDDAVLYRKFLIDTIGPLFGGSHYSEYIYLYNKSRNYFLYLEVNKLNREDQEFISYNFTIFLYKKKKYFGYDSLIITDTNSHKFITDEETENYMKQQIILIFKNTEYKQSIGILFNNNIKSCVSVVFPTSQTHPYSTNSYYGIYDIETTFSDKKRILINKKNTSFITAKAKKIIDIA